LILVCASDEAQNLSGSKNTGGVPDIDTAKLHEKTISQI
jgi:hypothetical protein